MQVFPLEIVFIDNFFSYSKCFTYIGLLYIARFFSKLSLYIDEFIYKFS